MMRFGGVVPGQKFTMDKHIHCRTKVEKQQKGRAQGSMAVVRPCIGGLRSYLRPWSPGEEDFYAWQGTTKLKQATEISILCQKGQKSASDPTPNQDQGQI